MSLALKRMARRALRIRNNDLYYHELMQIRRNQQLQILLGQSHATDDNEPHEQAKPYPSENEEPEVTEGPSSRDWQFTFLMTGGVAAFMFVAGLLTLLTLFHLGIIQPGLSSTSTSPTSVPAVP